ncbi:SDR family oxidoreductase [Glycocaulis profundi]|nr:SDR family oxidoreductase [Glycocaulis profundi]
MAKRLALVTGASSGIGAAFAKDFAARGWDVALVARRRERLEALAGELTSAHGIEALVVEADLAEPGAPAAIADALKAAGRHADALVNNAGAGQPGAFIATSWADQARFIQLMVSSYAELAHLLAPGMAERGYGRIVNVSSVSALLPSANAHTRFSGTLYPGAKSLLIKFSEALHLELEARGVHVSAVCPGYTWSEFHDVNGARPVVSRMPGFWMLKPEDVASSAWDAVDRGVTCRVPGAWYKFLSGLSRVLPDPVGQAMMRAQERRMAKALQAESKSA